MAPVNGRVWVLGDDDDEEDGDDDDKRRLSVQQQTKNLRAEQNPKNSSNSRDSGDHQTIRQLLRE